MIWGENFLFSRLFVLSIHLSIPAMSAVARVPHHQFYFIPPANCHSEPNFSNFVRKFLRNLILRKGQSANHVASTFVNFPALRVKVNLFLEAALK